MSEIRQRTIGLVKADIEDLARSGLNDAERAEFRNQQKLADIVA